MFAQTWVRSSVVWILGVVLPLGAAPVWAQQQAVVWTYEDESGAIYFSDVPAHKGFRPLRNCTEKHRAEALRKFADQRRGRATRAWDGVIAQASRQYGVAPGLVKAMVHVESLFDRHALSHKGAQGLMQLMPATARSLGVEDPFDPWQNIDGGTKYLRHLMQRFEGDATLALAAYNAGETAVRRYSGVPPYRETKNYVKRVMSLANRYRADFR